MPYIAALMLLLIGAAAPAPDLFDDIYARGQARNGDVRTVHASFTETTTSTLLRDPIVARGTLVAEMPAKLRLDYAAPERRTVIVTERELRITGTATTPAIVRDITTAQQRVKKYFVDKSPAELRKHFTVRAFADSSVAGTYQVDMVPTRKQIREGLSDLRIWVDEETLFLRQMRMTFATGDTKTFVLDKVRLDQPIAPGTFEAAEARPGTR